MMVELGKHAEQLGDWGPKLKKLWEDHCRGKGPEDMAQFVKHCKLSKCYDKKLMRITCRFAVRNEIVAGALQAV
eukprot:15483929-Alexandrium_andersonii.AAC.1